VANKKFGLAKSLYKWYKTDSTENLHYNKLFGTGTGKAIGTIGKIVSN
jgi:hypothetical protein